MSYYYTYNFVSPEAIYANIREELKSYFDTNVIDDVMFPIWTSKCLNKLGLGSYPLLRGVMRICNFEGKLPPEFHAVREAWLVTSSIPIQYTAPGAFYQGITTCLNQDYASEKPICNDNCNPELVNLVYKTVSSEMLQWTVKYLLKPGHITKTNSSCSRDCINTHITDCPDEFEIVGDKFTTNFRDGWVFLVYYADEVTQAGYSVIPDNYRIQEFIEAFIKYKLFEQLFNQVTDESANQIASKLKYYEQKSDEAYLLAGIETKKETLYQKARRIARTEHRFDGFVKQMYGRPTRGTWGMGPYRR